MGLVSKFFTVTSRNKDATTTSRRSFTRFKMADLYHEDVMYLRIRSLNTNLNQLKSSKNGLVNMPGIYTGMEQKDGRKNTRPSTMAEARGGFVVYLMMSQLTCAFGLTSADNATSTAAERINRQDAAKTILKKRAITLLDDDVEADLTEIHHAIDLRNSKLKKRIESWSQVSCVVNTEAMALSDDQMMMRLAEEMNNESEDDLDETYAMSPGAEASDAEREQKDDVGVEVSEEEEEEEVQETGGSTKADKRRARQMDKKYKRKERVVAKDINRLEQGDGGEKMSANSSVVQGQWADLQKQQTQKYKEDVEMHARGRELAKKIVESGGALTHPQISAMVHTRRAFKYLPKHFNPDDLTLAKKYQRNIQDYHVQRLTMLHLQDPLHDISAMAIVYTGSLKMLLDANNNPLVDVMVLPVLPEGYLDNLSNCPDVDMAGKFLVMGGQHGYLAFKEARKRDAKKMSVRQFLAGNITCLEVVSE